MRTTIEVDDELITAAMESTGLKTKRVVIEEALRPLVCLKSQEQIRLYQGKLHWEEDLDIVREGSFTDTDR